MAQKAGPRLGHCFQLSFSPNRMAPCHGSNQLPKPCIPRPSLSVSLSHTLYLLTSKASSPCPLAASERVQRLATPTRDSILRASRSNFPRKTSGKPVGTRGMERWEAACSWGK